MIYGQNYATKKSSTMHKVEGAVKEGQKWWLLIYSAFVHKRMTAHALKTKMKLTVWQTLKRRLNAALKHEHS